MPLAIPGTGAPLRSGIAFKSTPRAQALLALPVRRCRLRTHVPAIVLDGEDVAVKGRRPLLALHGHSEIPQSVTKVALDLVPLELWIVVDHVGGAAVTELLVNADFDKFVVERVQLAWIE